MTTPLDRAHLLIHDAQASQRCAAEVKYLNRLIEDLEMLADLTPGDIIGGVLLGTGIATALFIHPTVGIGMIAAGVVIYAVALDAKLVRIKVGKRAIGRGIEDLEDCIAKIGTEDPDG